MESDRYSRQVRFDGIGVDGQRRLASSAVLVLGVGALGSHAAAGLARAGIGRLTLVDRDFVELSNLPRQVLFDERDAAEGRPKALAAAEHLDRINSACDLEPVVEDFDAALWAGLRHRPNLVIDGTDNFPTRMLLNDLAARDGVPWIYGGAVGATGRAQMIVPGRTPCLRCLVPNAPPAGEVGTCETLGVLASAAAQVAAFQVAQAIRWIVSEKREFARGTFHCDVWNGTFGMAMSHAEPDPACASCATRTFPALAAKHAPSVVLCGRDSVQVRPRRDGSGGLDLDRLATRLSAVGTVERTRHLLRFTAEGCRFSVFPGGRALLQGVRDPDRARVLYDRWIGA